jgi:hypothetical protein
MFLRVLNSNKPGFYQGKHYTEYVEQIKELKRSEKLAKAETLLLGLVAAVEAEEAAEHHGKAPWYTEQLAIVYRKQHRYADELAILERYDRGNRPPVFAERKAKVKTLVAKSS